MTCSQTITPQVTGDGHGSRPLAICVFCGASDSIRPALPRAVQDLAKGIAAKHWSLVYGGGTRGLMGLLASAVVWSCGAKSVHGIIPRAMIETEGGVVQVPNEDRFGRTTIVSTMHERKLRMMQEADAFVALPGGFGTMEELFEMTTWNQLGIHHKPIVVFNIEGFFDEMLAWVKKSVEYGLIPADQASIIVVADTADRVLEAVENYRNAQGRYLLDWSISN
ncbi:lysine decarboxylase-like protein [Elsinoe ampelina]|uniref:Lysine decarboxylase-like protein n=1 Tax=Elsinoe ampelina TaxID=302913 RepID=A0A6A6G895_9PEZI|nr:lysine decarboxylase-like protein [Elsinoe ampelina]